tara:strand:+ start:194 stop:838 length:645 start_codon:yes stop_codon:yes gene_type:complete
MLKDIYLKKYINEVILFEEKEKSSKVMSKLDSLFDKIEDQGEDKLKDVLKDLDRVKKTKNKKNEEIQEGALLLVSTAVAAPVIMKGIGWIAKAIAWCLQKLENLVGSNYNFDKMGDQWQDWWNGKSKDLHDFYLKPIKAIVSKVCTICGLEKTEEEKYKIANRLWMCIVALLMLDSGIHALHGLLHHSYGIAGIEGALSAIKAGEIIEFAFFLS